jgi:aromatic-amino-acid transaminase
LLHACCHNPTGADLTDDQWTQVIEVVTQRGLIPFLDMAYQGFGDGIEADGKVVRRFAEAGGALFVSTHFPNHSRFTVNALGTQHCCIQRR